jgi:DNA replication protein DnaD
MPFGHINTENTFIMQERLFYRRRILTTWNKHGFETIVLTKKSTSWFADEK